MQVDNPQQTFSSPSPFTFPSSTFEEFFNLDLLSSNGPGSSTSRSSSPRSPPGSFGTLPPTPPQPFASFADPTAVTADNSFFNLYLEDDFTKTAPALPTGPAAPYDFLGAFTTLSSSSSSSSSTGASPETLAIDPQLMATPATSKALSDFDEDEEHEDQDEQVDESAIAPVKVGGKGKARKGTVASGGVTKRSGGTGKENSSSSAASRAVDHDDVNSDDWRPSPEEYKKMSSKEKRQLRNKISARNFRVRRKEYISTLEGDIAERDQLLDAIRTELGSTRSENVALRQEISALKKTLLAGRGTSSAPVLPPPAPLPSPAPSPTASPSSPTQTQGTQLLTANTQKDLPTSPRLRSGAGFWGGLGMGGGITPVHTTLVPELGLGLLGRKGVASGLQENINPALNGVDTGASKQAEKDEKKTLSVNGMNAPGPGFDAFADMNPFTLKTLDAYRMQLWGKMAAQHHAQQQQQQHQQQQVLKELGGLAGGLRPHYFTAAKAYPSPPTSPKLPTVSPKLSSTSPGPSTYSTSQRDAALVAMASQTLVQRLGSAFWDAFSGSPAAGSSSKEKGKWDADKVRRVLEGRAVVRVVDVDQPVSVSSSSSASAPPVPAPVHDTGKKEEWCSRAKCSVTDKLEESMRSLTIAKK